MTTQEHLNYVKSFQPRLQTFGKLENRAQTLTELKFLIITKAFNLENVSGLTLTFSNEQNILTVYSDDAYIAFVASILSEMNRKGFI